MSPGFRLVAAPYSADIEPAAGSTPLTVTKVSVERSAPLTTSRARVCVSAHHANSGSVTEYFPALLVRPKIGAFPFGEMKRIFSRKLLGRSSVPQSPVPRRPARPDIVIILRQNLDRAQRTGRPLLFVLVADLQDGQERTAQPPSALLVHQAPNYARN